MPRTLAPTCRLRYRNHVDGADRGAIAVRLWRGLALTLLRPTLKSFFAEQTTFSKRLSAFRANGKFEDPSAGRSLRSFVQSLRGEFGPLRVYCWRDVAEIAAEIEISERGPMRAYC